MRYYIHGGQAFCASNIASIEKEFNLSERNEGCEREVFFASNPDLDTQDILYFLSTTPMFAESRLAIVKDAKSNPKLFRAILDLPETPEVHVIAVDVIDTQPKKKRAKAKTVPKKGATKAKPATSFPQMRTIEKAGFIVLGEEVFNRLTGPQNIQKFVQTHFAMAMDYNDARGIFDSYDQNMSLILNDFNNILMYMGRVEDWSPNGVSSKLRQAKPRTAKDLIKYLPFYKTTNIFPLLDAFAEKNKPNATRLLHNALQSNMDNSTLIALFNSIFRQVKHIYGLQLDPEMVMEKKTLMPFAITALQRRAVAKWTIPQMTLFFHEASKLDYLQKTGGISPRDALIAVVEMLPYNPEDGLKIYEI